MEHPLKADIGCRNTLHNAVAQSAAEYLPRLLGRGVRRFRVEFLDESPDAVRSTLALYRAALDGERDPRSLWRELKATNRYGITRGQLAIVE
jgi:putative protease